MVLEVNDIYRLVREGMMGVAMKMLRQGLDGSSYELKSTYDNVEMLCQQYYKYSDSGMTTNVKSAVLQLTDDVMDSLAARSSLRYEYSIRRNWHIGNEMLMAALSSDYDTSHGISVEMDAQLIVLFRQVWLSGFLDANAIQMLRKFVLSDNESNLFARRMVVGALMLRCVRYYDIRIVQLLMESKLAEASVAVVMIMMARKKRIDCDECSLNLFRNYLEDGDNLENFAIIYNNVIRTFETQRIASEMRNKIFPIVKEQGMKFRENIQSTPLFDENGLNPEWEDKLEKSGIMDKMRRINDMQFEGADIHFESFQMMKSGAFFLDTAHWFFPFDAHYHQLDYLSSSEENSFGDFLMKLNLCDSDLYSLFFMFKGMGVTSLDDALRKFSFGNYKELKRAVDNEELWKRTARLSFIAQMRFAVMNLYRFYQLAPNHSDMTSPFAHIIYSEESTLGYSIIPPDIRYESANLLFKAQQWSSARMYFMSVIDDYITDDPLIYQKMGYCSEKNQRWSEAVDDYNKSDILIPDDLWTLRHSAYCYRQLGDNELAATLYRKALDLDSSQDKSSSSDYDKSSVTVLDSLVDIYLESGDYAEAKPLLHKLEYIRNSHEDLMRLGYCLFMLGDMAEASRMLDKACFGSESKPLDYFVRAISSADEDQISEACLLLAESDVTILEMLDSQWIKSMFSRLSTDEQYKIKSTINKYFLVQ